MLQQGTCPSSSLEKCSSLPSLRGAKITNAMGKEVSFDNVTKGSLVQVIINETTSVVERLMVM